MPSDDTERPKLGEYLRRHRILRGETMRSLGGTTLSSSYITQVEKSDITDVSVSKLLKLSRVYEVPVDAILRDVYGAELNSLNTGNPLALAIGESVLALPENRREIILDFIESQVHASQEQ